MMKKFWTRPLWKQRIDIMEGCIMELDHTYLFVLCINNGGSTLIERILSRCKNASGLRTEGQSLIHSLNPPPMRHKLNPLVSSWSEFRTSIADPNNYDWNIIKRVWHQRWNMSKRVLVQKSPRDLFRAEMIEHNFSNTHFIIMSRNPYSICETGKKSKKTGGREKIYSLAEIFARRVKHWVECHTAQTENIKKTKKKIVIRYEDLVNDPTTTEQQIVNFIPALSDVKCSGPIFVKNRNPKIIKNMDIEKIKRLATCDIYEINELLRPHVDLLSFFGYYLIDPSNKDRHYHKRHHDF